MRFQVNSNYTNWTIKILNHLSLLNLPSIFIILGAIPFPSHLVLNPLFGSSIKEDFKMAASNVQMQDLTIPNGTAVSNIVTSPKAFDDGEAIALYAPAVLDALTFTLEVCQAINPTAASTWVTLQIGDPAADAAPPPAGKGRVYFELACVMAYRIKSSGNVAADRTWKQSKSAFL